MRRDDAQVQFDLNNARMLMGGQLVQNKDGRTFDSVNPANEEILASVPQASVDDVRAAVDAARSAQPDWSALPVVERGNFLKRLAAALRRHGEQILAVEVLDTGNIISEMRRDVESGAGQLEYYAGLGYELKGSTIPATSGNLHLTIREPYGVVGRIIAFNHPLLFATAKLGAPLIAGNTIVLKPSEQSPLSACYLSCLCQKIFPPGVVNIVTGFGSEAGDALVCDPRVKRIAFIGSVKTGMQIQHRAAEHAVKHISLELGGKNPLIVFPDADLEKAVTGAIKGMNFGWQGQSCGSTSRLFLHADIYNKFMDDLTARVASMKMGDPLDESTQVGPINNKAQFEKVQNYVQNAIKEGARLALGGRRPEGERFNKGYWFEPTIFTDMQPDMKLAREEVFGPILSVFKWQSLDQTLEIANSLEYGLTGSVWTQDIDNALRTAKRLQTGYVWINDVGAHYPAVPFGGYKNSGIGKEEAFDDMLSYTEEKSINIIL